MEGSITERITFCQEGCSRKQRLPLRRHSVIYWEVSVNFSVLLAYFLGDIADAAATCSAYTSASQSGR